MAKKLDGKVAVITGGNSGMGLATAKLFVREGAYVYITGRRQAELDAAVKEIGKNVTAVRGDVADLGDLDRLYATVKEKHEKVDVVFANAGAGEFVPFGQVTEAHFDKLFDINVKGLLFTVQKALPLMPDGASVILNGSIAGYLGSPAFGVYSATKAAVRSFARSWTTDLKDRKIRVNTLSPGPIDTPSSTPSPRRRTRWSSSSPGSPPRCRWAGWGGPRRSPPWPCSWPPTTAPTARPPSSWSTEA